MASSLEFNFLQTFTGSIWNTLAVPDKNLLVIEVRDEGKHETNFSILDFDQNKFLLKDKIFDESWWIGLTGATSDVVFFHIYLNMDNPDEKAIMAWHIYEQRVLWKLDYFILSYLNDKYVYGFFPRDDKPMVAVNILTGVVMENVLPVDVLKENIRLQMPFQYIEGNDHFETVKSFLTSKLKVVPVMGMEYLEYENYIFISYQVLLESLANYLVVVTDEGELVLHVKMDDHLKGLGLGTFFILSGCLFFVKNKRELISYKIV